MEWLLAYIDEGIMSEDLVQERNQKKKSSEVIQFSITSYQQYGTWTRAAHRAVLHIMDCWLGVKWECHFLTSHRRFGSNFVNRLLYDPGLTL